MEFLPLTTPTPVSAFLTADADGLKRVAVVGNGPLSTEDRICINNHTNVVRFNDYGDKNWVAGDRVTMHCSTTDQFRHAWVDPNVTKWYVASQLRHLEENATLYTWSMSSAQVRLYRTRFLWTVALGIEPVTLLAPWFDTYRLFVGCSACGDRCLNKNADSGFSRGAIALNALEDDSGVAHIDVYGMNWNGGHVHVDFMYPTIVRECCTKCTIHSTPTNEYNGLETNIEFHRMFSTGNLFVQLVPMWLVLGVATWGCVRRRHRHRRRAETKPLEVEAEEQTIDSEGA